MFLVIFFALVTGSVTYNIYFLIKKDKVKSVMPIIYPKSPDQPFSKLVKILFTTAFTSISTSKSQMHSQETWRLFGSVYATIKHLTEWVDMDGRGERVVEKSASITIKQKRRKKTNQKTCPGDK